MKHSNRVHERLTTPVRADHILERIRIITRELEMIQTEIYGRLSQGPETEKTTFLEDAAATQVVGQFRVALDHARHMLWLCTKAAGTGGPAQDRKLARAAALLQALAPAGTSRPKGGLVTQAPVSFFERLDRVIDNYVEDGGNLVKPDLRRRPKT